MLVEPGWVRSLAADRRRPSARTIRCALPELCVKPSRPDAGVRARSCDTKPLSQSAFRPPHDSGRTADMVVCSGRCATFRLPRRDRTAFADVFQRRSDWHHAAGSRWSLARRRARDEISSEGKIALATSFSVSIPGRVVRSKRQLGTATLVLMVDEQLPPGVYRTRGRARRSLLSQ